MSHRTPSPKRHKSSHGGSRRREYEEDYYDGSRRRDKYDRERRERRDRSSDYYERRDRYDRHDRHEWSDRQDRYGQRGEDHRSRTSVPVDEPPVQALDMKEDMEEKARQRRERVEQWRQKRAAEEAAANGTSGNVHAPNGVASVDTNHHESDRGDGQAANGDEVSGKKWSLEDDDEDEDENDEGMQPVTTETAQESLHGSVDGPPAPPSMKNTEEDDATADGLLQKPVVRRNPFASMGGTKNASSASDSTNRQQKQMFGMNGKPKMQIGLKRKHDGEDEPAQVKIKNRTDEKADGHNESDLMKVDEPSSNAAEDDDVDPLDAFMVDVSKEALQIKQEDAKRMHLDTPKEQTPIIVADEEEDAESSEEEDVLALAAKRVKKKDIPVVDHSQVNYEPFRKDFYIEPPEMRDMTPDQVDLLRIGLDGIKIRGVNCPKPIKKWTHCGLPAGTLEVIRKLNYTSPTSIQAQAIPAIMKGRDVIGVAKTGSGKTIAFLLPMFRHIKDQRPLENMEGPIAVIMTPTRELAVQIHRECKPFLKVLGLRAICAYGGSPIKDQIADLKRGAEIIVCTPGRMIDLLTANSGRVTNLKRVTYLVLDEADRMFDMGFEPQVMKIVNNVRPDRQTVLFSATFPRQMEALARKVLRKPLEITVGGRSVVCEDVDQKVEVREESTKFVRLLEILGEFFNEAENDDGRVLIFVDRQEAADNLLRDLIRRGYPCMSLHGGKDQTDRDSTIADFKSGVSNILVATSVAARGLDVKQLKVVINYECPNHMEDYVHRVGRTGRAGNKGTAYTFITPEQDRYAIDILKALKLSGQTPPKELQDLADSFQEKVKAGREHFAGSGFGGKGLERFDKDRDLVKKIQKRAYGGEDEESDEEEGDGEKTPSATKPVEDGTATVVGAAPKTEAANSSNAAFKAAQEAAARISALVGTSKAGKAADIIREINAKYKENVGSDDTLSEHSLEIEINDYPQKARWRVTNKEQIVQIGEVSGAAITTRGTYFPPGKQPGPGERKLYLLIEGENSLVIERARTEIKRILTEATVQAMESEARGGPSVTGQGRYSVV
ncbi:hypothetical protein BZG36_01868 [Bifiguratus adelaidae]|uniref:RNA helicase n=1 Tax=Bifiguratus adelaidae TaxID=1938954 RepID=A0A261Y2B7_9FUNG|nr:hypothetical protein BZG36_01868 [Bifiguratus adelaidae]